MDSLFPECRTGYSMAWETFWGWLPDMHILASEKQERSTVFSRVGGSFRQPVAVCSFTSDIRASLAVLCFSILVSWPVAAQTEEPESNESQEATTLLILASGKYQGVWRSENGMSNALLMVLTVDGQSIAGKLTLVGVEDYSGDRIRGKIEQNDDGSLSVKFKTRDGKWRSKAVFDGQLLIGTYMYEFQDRRVQKLVKGEWAAQRTSE